MKNIVRKSLSKVWETSFRHNFNTTYLKDPDLHVLLYISGESFNEINREALRDYMKKHGSKASDPDFQAQVFITASIKMARGDKAFASDVLSKIENNYSEAYSDGELSQSGSNEKQNIISTQVDSSTTTVGATQLAHAKRSNEENLGKPAATSSNPSKPDLDVPSAVKHKVILDFGPELETPLETKSVEDVSQIPPRNSWLAGHDT